MMLLRARNFSTFYRKRPESANFANLFFECWYIGTGLLVVVTRLVKFLIAASLWLGRIDAFFLDDSVAILGKKLDNLPEAFYRDILVHEAHHHPFIERLGEMYLMRLRYGKNFGTVSGVAWRSLLVTCLMPWIAKYKVNSAEDVFYDAKDESRSEKCSDSKANGSSKNSEGTAKASEEFITSYMDV